MDIKSYKSTIKKITNNHPQFVINDGIFTASRAGFEISQRCPDNYASLIKECINHGWLKPVAYMTEREMIIAGLVNQS